MKRMLRNCLATMGLSLLLLAILATCFGGRFLCIATVFQTLFASVVIHAGLYGLKRFESSYFYIEIILEVGYTLGVILGLGYLFDWYSSTPPWILVVMVVLVYALGGMIGIFRIKTEVDEINCELNCRRKQNYE